jgi:multidrug efflux pump subunit AcrA (membrane-fusion protein)
MNAEVVASPASESLPKVSFMEPIRPSPAPARHWRFSLAVSLGALLLVASLVIAGLSLRSHADHPAAPSPTVSPTADGEAWYSLGKVDIEGGVTPLYPLQPGRVRRIVARENVPLKKGEPIFYLENTEQTFKVRLAEADLQSAHDRLAIAQAKVEEADKQIDAQKIAIEVAKKNVDKARLRQGKEKDFQRSGVSGDKETVEAAGITVEQAEAGVTGEKRKMAVMEAIKRQAEGAVQLAQTNIKAKQEQLANAKYAVEECVVRAPIDGTPLRILVSVGQTLGSNPHQPAVQFAPDLPLLVRAEVEQEFVARVRDSQSVVIEDHVTGKECGLANWYAPNRSNNPEALQMNNDVRNLECIVHIESKTREVRIGQRVRVRFVD